MNGDRHLQGFKVTGTGSYECSLSDGGQGVIYGAVTLEGANSSFYGTPTLCGESLTLSSGASASQYHLAPLLSADASKMAYTAGTSSDWASAAPTTVQSALDRIASAVKILRGSAIP